MMGTAVMAYMSKMAMNPQAMMAFIAGAIVFLVLLVIVSIIIALLVATAYPRFARTGSIGEAFSFGAITAHIGKIGWGGYILALIVLWIILSVISGILWYIPFIGWLLLLIALPFLAIFEARYLSLLYDSAPAP